MAAPNANNVEKYVLVEEREYKKLMEKPAAPSDGDETDDRATPPREIRLILETLPAKVQKAAILAVHFLAKSQRIQVDSSNFEVLVDGRRIEGSNLSDLLFCGLECTQKCDAIGIDSFVRVLRESGFPTRLLNDHISFEGQ